MASFGPTLINSYIVGSGGVSSFSFTSIPNTYTDLLIKLSARGTTTGLPDTQFTFNSDTGSNYQAEELVGNGSGVSVNSYTTTNCHFMTVGSDATANTFSNADIYISNYTSSSGKAIFTDATAENNTASTNFQMRLVGYYWSGTSAISTITFTIGTGSFAQYSTFYLYGIKNS